MTDLKDILYVDDEPDIREVTRMTLESLGGLRVNACESGKEAIHMLKQHTPQLILLDVMMPEMDGPATLEVIRALPQGKNIPVIFMTAKVQSHEIAHYMTLGCIGVVAKPFDALQLPGQILDLWGKYKAG